MMRPIPTLLLLAGLAAMAPGEETEKKLKAEEVPAPVMATMVKAAAGSKLSAFEQETKKDQVVFTAEFKDAAGKEQEVTVAADGTLVSVAPEDDADEGKSEK